MAFQPVFELGEFGVFSSLLFGEEAIIYDGTKQTTDPNLESSICLYMDQS